jgi:hypothetical protein
MAELETVADFDRLLQHARTEVARMAAAEPDFNAIAVVLRQLDALHAITRDGRAPVQDEKDRFNFGLIASRELGDYPVAQDLYALASFVIWWGEPGHPPKA